ncbi:MAG: T9SS type A sorting domain-containing protein [Bacteroidales bacterium]|nr:T9SS type A sorting domain-containing protein [Bacteroidales bacterium]MCF8406100.1 T9SS type A sorting domain-containing protein [Bacteroidales bacterium]
MCRHFLGRVTLLGNYDVTTHNWVNGNLVLMDGFTIYELIPSLTAINPTSVYLGDLFTLSVIGENTHFNDSGDTDTWLINEDLTILPTAVNIVSNTELEAYYNIPEDGMPGFWTVFATNSTDGDMLLEEALEIIDTITTVQNYEVFESINIFPNPSNGDFYISHASNGNEQVVVQLFDLCGKSLCTWPFNKIKLEKEKLDLPPLAKGAYYLKFSSHKGIVTKRLIIN